MYNPKCWIENAVEYIEAVKQGRQKMRIRGESKARLDCMNIEIEVSPQGLVSQLTTYEIKEILKLICLKCNCPIHPKDRIEPLISSLGGSYNITEIGDKLNELIERANEGCRLVADIVVRQLGGDNAHQQ